MADIQRRLISRSAQGDAGSILILALWSLSFLAVFAVILNYGVRQKATLVKRLDNRDKFRLIADAGLKQAVVDLKLLSGTSDEGKGDSWTLADSAGRRTDVGDGIVRYALIDEARKININLSHRKTLEEMFRVVAGLGEMGAQELAASIVDWRDNDSMLSIPVGSAEDHDYTGREYPYEAKDADFQVLEELLLVNGMTNEIFDKIKDYVTVFGDGKININTAPKEVFLLLGLDDYLAELICLYRKGEDGIDGTEDDNVFGDRALIVPTLSQFYNLSDANVASLTQVAGEKLVTNSTHFTVQSTATLRNTKMSFEARGVVDKTGKIFEWREP